MEYNALRLERKTGLERQPGESAGGYFHRIRSQLDQLEVSGRSQWTGRRTWSTHTYPGGCWICDIFACCEALLGEVRRLGSLEEGSIQDRIMAEYVDENAGTVEEARREIGL